jgi:hypothetical protein
MPNFVRYTGLSPRVARMVFAPVKLAIAALLIAGLFVRLLSLAGAAAAVAISLVYVAFLLHRDRRAADGLIAFSLFGALAAALFLVR